MASRGASRLQTDQIVMCKTGVLVSLSVCLLLQPPSPSQAAAPSDAAPGASAASRRRVLLTAPSAQYVPLRARLEPFSGDILIDDSDDLDIGKRFDDYGHMRFGKRGDPEDKFDDYGHMRFGRGHV